MPLSGSSSVQDKEDLYAGEWPRVYAIVDPLAAATEVNLGVVKDGVLRTGREELEFFGSDFPQTLELSAPVSVTMQFGGTAHELTYGLLHFLVGDAAIDDASQYVYPGAGCAFSDIDVTLRGERINCDEHMLVFQMHQARASGAFEIGSAASDVIGTPLEINALDDSAGLFGGSAAAPLGWIWASHT